LKGIENGHDFLYSEINNYHPDFLGQSFAQLANHTFTIQDYQTTIAREYGFASWQTVEGLKEATYHFTFENAVNFLLNGNIQALSQLLTHESHLIKSTSQYGHRATLLHYVSSNGVEIWRQSAPNNLVEMTKLLLLKGADKTAKMQVYDGLFTPYELLTSSIHPYNAGIGKELEVLLI